MGGYVGRAMVRTPWGDASTLRERRLSPGRGMPRDEARRNQRERLFAAMVAVTAERGYADTSVSDLVEVSGISSRSFYQHFADKEECFLATMEVILANLHRLVLGELEGEGSIEQRAQGAARALIDNLQSEPETTRLWLVESFCAGERAQGRVNLAFDALAAQLQKLYAGIDKGEMPEDLTRAILGGVVGVVYNRMANGRAEEIPEVATAMQDWVLGFPVPPGPLRPKVRRRRGNGGNGPPPFAAHVPSERLLRAFAEVVAEKGYAETWIADVAARAAVSQATLYSHFSGKEDLLNAALDSSGAQMIAATLPAVRRSPEWPRAMKVAAETLCAFFAAEPAFARLREVEVFSAGPAAVRMRDRTGHELHAMVTRLAPEAPEGLDSLRVEATLAAIHAMLYRWIISRGTESIPDVAPTATYLALAPWLGAEAAYAAACD
jgi:AcrR family transcriptional regulator